VKYTIKVLKIMEAIEYPVRFNEIKYKTCYNPYSLSLILCRLCENEYAIKNIVKKDFLRNEITYSLTELGKHKLKLLKLLFEDDKFKDDNILSEKK